MFDGSVCAHVLECTYIYSNVCMCVCMCVCICVCACVYVLHMCKLVHLSCRLIVNQITPLLIPTI